MFMGIGGIDMKKILIILFLISFPSIAFCQYDKDMLGVTRNGDGIWDRGAYEYVGSPVSTSSSSSSTTTTITSTSTSSTTTYIGPPSTTTTMPNLFGAPNRLIIQGGIIR